MKPNLTINAIFLLILFLFSCRKKQDKPKIDDIGKKDTTIITYQPPHDIQMKNQDGNNLFWNAKTRESFIPRGVNYFWINSGTDGLQNRFLGVGIFDASRTRQDFRTLKAMGYNTVRIFIDGCSDDGICIGNSNGSGLNGNYINNIVQTMEIAQEEDIFLLLTSNDLPDDGGYWDISNKGANDQFEGYRNAHYLTPKGIESAQKYWGDLLSTLQEHNAPFEAVFAWELLNEQWYFSDKPPFSLTSGSVICANGKSYDMAIAADKKAMAVEGIMCYIDSVRSVINEYDPKSLVTMGFFVPDYPNPIRTGDFRYVETADLLNRADLDFFDFHAYPGEDPIDKISENFGMTGYTSKPIIMGEFGAFINRYTTISSATTSILSWMAQSCQLGFDGWLYWGLYRAPEAIGDATWGFFDADSEMLDTLSPLHHPDACNPALLPPENIALNKTVTASASLSDQPPEYAVDGSYSTQWGSGNYAPQWIEVDLGAEYDIGRIKLYVAQYPEGNTEHTLEAKSESGTWQLLHSFTQNTSEGDVLDYQDTGTNSYRYIRITTTNSPSWVSWKEIEVYE